MAGIILIIILALAIFIPQKDILQQIEALRRTEGPKFDSLNKQINAEIRLYDSIKYLIATGKISAADRVLDTLIKKDPHNEQLYCLKGQAYDAGKQYDSAIYEYNIALSNDHYPNILDKRAITFIKLKEYQAAINDYKDAYNQNYDFAFKLGQAFEKANQIDSALAYYEIYLAAYPDSIYRNLTAQGILPDIAPDSLRIRISKLCKINQ